MGNDIPIEAEVVVERPRRQPWIAVMIFGCIVGAMAICGGITALVVQKSKAEEAEKLLAEFKDNPVVVQQLGGLTECTGTLLSDFSDDREFGYDSMYEVEGPKGKGKLMVMRFLGVPISVVLKTAGGRWELLDDEAETITKKRSGVDAATESPGY